MRETVGFLTLSLLLLLSGFGCSKQSEEQPKPQPEAAEQATPLEDTPGSNATSGTFRIYGFQTAEIEYSVSSPMMAAATRTVYVSDWGSFQTEITKGTRPNGQEFETWMITRGGEIYNILPEDKLAIKAEVPNRSAAGIDLGAMIQLSGGREAALQGLKQQGITLLDSAEVAGYRCQAYEHESAESLVKVWAHQGIPLKMIAGRMNAQGGMTNSEVEAVSVKFNQPIDAEHFELPEGFEVLTTVEYRDWLQAQKDSGATETTE